MKIYAKAEKVPEGNDYITAGKLYEVTGDKGDFFECKANVQGLIFCKWENCYHLDFGNYCGNWIRIEAGALEELNLKEGDVIQCVEEVDCRWAASKDCSYTVSNDAVIGIDKEFWHEVKHLFTVVSRAEETMGNSVEEELFAGKFKIGDKIHWKYKSDDWDPEDFWQQRVYTVVSYTRAEHEDGGHISNLEVTYCDLILAGEDKVKKPKFKVGDKVRSVNNLYSFCGTVGVVDSVMDYDFYGVRMPHDNNVYYHFECELNTVEDTQVEQPKTWAHLTDEEKGALLLAYHNGEIIECWQFGSDFWLATTKPKWDDMSIYRVKPAPIIEEREEGLYWRGNGKDNYFTFNDFVADFKLTYRLVDGILDEDSVKVVKV